jgi:FMN phosphatase YigB (HAD superfamily)
MYKLRLTDLYKQIKEETTQSPQSEYKIYCDMDGVLVDFDKGYKELTGKETHHADVQDKNDFWNFFRQSLENKKMKEKDYWANLQWMPDGKELWNYIKKYNPTLLSAPSRDPQSRWGKRIWVKKNIPGTPLILAAADKKKNYSKRNSILIDDRVSNINEWNAEGGIGIFHVNTENTIKQLQKYGL